MTQLTAPTWKTTSSTADSVTVAWNPVANASGYVVEYKGESDANFTPAPQTSDTTITITNLAADTTYKLRVYAVGDGTNYSNSTYSSETTVITQELPTDETPSTVVTSLADVVDPYDNVVTLREAITVYANDGDTVTFDTSLKGGTITLGGSEIEINKSITIDASALRNGTDGSPGIAIDANSKSRIFYVRRGSVEINSLAFSGGNATDGGTIYVLSSSLTITNSNFHDNTGGAIDVRGSSLTISKSTFQNNTGGAIYADWSTLTISNSTFLNNTTNYAGGAIGADESTLYISSSIFIGNKSKAGSAIYLNTYDHNESCEAWAYLDNVTIYNNVATTSGALYTHGSEFYVYNSIVAENVNGDFSLEDSIYHLLGNG